MNHREPTSVPRGTGQALPCLALLLLPILAQTRAWSRPNLSTPTLLPRGYLIAVGSPTLRFQEAAPPPDLVARPPASAPPKVTAEDSDSSRDVVVFTPPSGHASSETPVASPESVPANDSESSPASNLRIPAPILRDELHRHARPEDVLPYFQIPASELGDANVIVPLPRSPRAPAPLPSSSATYSQSPR